MCGPLILGYSAKEAKAGHRSYMAHLLYGFGKTLSYTAIGALFGAFGAIVAWLPQARLEQIRRLQVCAQSVSGPVFLCRPEAAQHEASAAPLRVQATFGLDWELHVRILKRRGRCSDQLIALPSVPGGLASVITPRLRKPSRLLSREVAADAVGSPVVSAAGRRHATSH